MNFIEPCYCKAVIDGLIVEIKLDKELKINHKPVSGSIHLPDSGIVLVLGNNGVGKTTLFNHLLSHQSKYQLQDSASFISQYRLAPVGAVKVSQIFQMIENDFPNRVVSKFSDFDLIQRFGATELINKETGLLSGGENQLIKILLGFFLKAKYYFMDEPFQFLDEDKFQVIFDYIVGSKDQTMVIIDHRNPELFNYAHSKFRIVAHQDHIEVTKIG